MADYTKADVQQLQGDIKNLESSIRQLTGAMKMYAPRHEVDEAIRAKVAKLGDDVADAIGDAQEAANAALTASLNADDAATRAVRSAREAQVHVKRLRFREWCRIVAVFGMGTVVLLIVNDRHVHKHLGLDELPLTPVGGFPLALALAISLAVVSLTALWLSRNGKDQ